MKCVSDKRQRVCNVPYDNLQHEKARSEGEHEGNATLARGKKPPGLGLLRAVIHGQRLETASKEKEKRNGEVGSGVGGCLQ